MNDDLKGDIFTIILKGSSLAKKYKLSISWQKSRSIDCIQQVFKHSFDHVDNLEDLKISISNMIL